jgi:hypothetical protein
MIEAGRASSIASAVFSKLVTIEKESFEAMTIIEAGRSGADIVLGEQAKVTRRRVFP